MNDAEPTHTSSRCDSCGTTLPDGAKFCQACGSPLHKTNDTHQQSSSTTPGNPGQSTQDLKGVRSFTFLEAVSRGFSKYAVFSGRASRPEYWYWQTFQTLLGLGIGFLTVPFVTSDAEYDTVSDAMVNLATLVTFLPTVAVAVRRLHDTNRSGWRLLLGLTGIGIIPLIFWGCESGQSADNRYGPPVVLPSNETMEPR
mgnify:CR=1 FL=1